MSEERITKVRVDSKRPPRGKTDWKRLRSLTDEEILRAAQADPDNPPLTEDQLARLEPVPEAKSIRRRLGLTQEEFAATYHLSLATLRDWEQERYQPDQAARTLLRVIASSPDMVKRALAETADAKPQTRA